MKTQYECVFISNWPHDANCYQCGKSREEHDQGTATFQLDDVQQHSGDGGEGISDFHRSLESRDEEANTREGQATLIEAARASRDADAFILRIQKSREGREGLESDLLDKLYDWENSTPENKARFKHIGWFGIAHEFWEENGSLSPEIDEVERNRLQSKRDAEEAEWYANERSRAATADNYWNEDLDDE